MTTDNVTQDEETGRTRPFADILITLNRGRTHTELSTAIQSLVEAVEDTKRKGSVTLTITVSPHKADGVLEVVDVVTVKLPKHDRAASIFYSDDDHNLVRDDPRQLQLPLRDINADNPNKPGLKEAK